MNNEYYQLYNINLDNFLMYLTSHLALVIVEAVFKKRLCESKQVVRFKDWNKWYSTLPLMIKK